MNTGQPWQWPMDHWTTPRIESCPRSLDGHLILWNALVFHILGQPLSRVWLRDVESHDLFCICDSEGDIVQARLTESSDISSVRMVCADALNNAKIARLFFLGASGQLRERDEITHQIVIVRADGSGLWNTWPESRHKRSSFRLFDDAGLAAFIRRPAMQIWDTLKAALKDPQSDASFSRDWLGKTDEQRTATIWNWSPDTRQNLRVELEEMLHCALLCNDFLWQKDDSWTLSVPDPANIWLYPAEEEWDEYPVPDQLKRAIEQLWHHYAPFNSEVLKHECAYAWKQNTITAFFDEAREPTAHERLEAMLRWRDWLTEVEV